MTVTVSAADAQCDWGATGPARVAQNVRNLLGLLRYEIPYDRLRGVPGDLTDLPATEAASRYAAMASELLDRYEPRAEVLRVLPDKSLPDGTTNFKVVINIVD